MWCIFGKKLDDDEYLVYDKTTPSVFYYKVFLLMFTINAKSINNITLIIFTDDANISGVLLKLL